MSQNKDGKTMTNEPPSKLDDLLSIRSRPLGLNEIEYIQNEAAAEIERLREALASIVLLDLSYSTTKIARAALKGHSHDR
jgi:hypothetical protein